MNEIVIRGGNVVTSDIVAQMDVGISGGKITELAAPDSITDGQKTLDANGKYVFPGLIDAHVHVNIPLGIFVTKDGFSEATRAAAHGGTTTIIPFAIPDPDETPLEAFKRRREDADGSVYTNYGLHACVNKVSEDIVAELPDLIEQGVASVKMFMVYEGRLMLTHGEIREVMETVANNDGLCLIHAEDEELIEYLIQQHVDAGTATYSEHPEMHPNISETTAMRTIAELVAELDCPTYFVHTSTHEARQVLESARNKDLPLLAETCPHYLALVDEVYQRDDGERFVCSPPIRSEENGQQLWQMVEEGLIQTINSDHCCYDTGQKEKYRDDITKIPMGLPGVETRNTAFYTEAVANQRLSVNQFVALTSTNIAKMLGLYPKKGTITVDSDADLVIYDPEVEWTLRAEDLHMETDYTPFERRQMTGKPITTIVDGTVVVENERLVGEPAGSFVPTDGSNASELFSEGI